MERHAKIVIWARDRAHGRGALEPVQLLYGGAFDEHGLRGIGLTDGLADPVHLHVLALSNLSARFLAHHLWEPIERDDFTSDAEAAAVLVVLDDRVAHFDHDVEQLKRLRDACGTRTAVMGILWTHDDADDALRLTPQQRETLLDFGGLLDAPVYESADLGSLAAFDAFFRAIAHERGLGDHYRVVTTRP